MATKSFASCWSTRQSDLYRSSTLVEDAVHVFDEMTTSDFDDWRPPNRILEVTIHKVCYPITESLLRQVFGPFGEVEHVQVFGRNERVFAQVIFQSKYDAVDAFGDLHGRSIYDGCCQLDIHYGVSYDADVPLARNIGNARPTSSSVVLCSSVIFPPTLDNDISSENLPVEAAESGEPTEAAVPVPAVCDSISPILDVMDSDDNDEFPMLAIMTSTIITEHVQVAVPIFVAVPTLDINPSDPNIKVSASDLMRFPDSDIKIYVPMDSRGTVQIPTEFARPALRLSLPSLSVSLPINQSACHVSDETAMSIQWAEKQPWPPPTQLEATGMDASIWPLPWPSFCCYEANEQLTQAKHSLLWKQLQACGPYLVLISSMAEELLSRSVEQQRSDGIVWHNHCLIMQEKKQGDGLLSYGVEARYVFQFESSIAHTTVSSNAMELLVPRDQGESSRLSIKYYFVEFWNFSPDLLKHDLYHGFNDNAILMAIKVILSMSNGLLSETSVAWTMQPSWLGQDLIIEFKQHDCYCDTLYFCMWLIPRNLEILWSVSWALDEANCDIKKIYLATTCTWNSRNSGPGFLQAGTIDEVQFSILPSGGMTDMVQFLMPTLSEKFIWRLMLHFQVSTNVQLSILDHYTVNCNEQHDLWDPGGSTLFIDGSVGLDFNGKSVLCFQSI